MRWALVNGYQDDLVLDRINNNGGYFPENCRWVTRRESSRNRKRALLTFTAFGETKAVVKWVEDPRCLVGNDLLRKRLGAGWPPEMAIITPSQHRGRRLVGFVSGGLPRGLKTSKRWKQP
jgi:hypothetical protein